MFLFFCLFFLLRSKELNVAKGKNNNPLKWQRSKNSKKETKARCDFQDTGSGDIQDYKRKWKFMMKRLTELSPALLSVVNDQADALDGICHCKWIPVSLIKYPACLHSQTVPQLTSAGLYLAIKPN